MKRVQAIFLFFVSFLVLIGSALADTSSSSLSFTPPTTDYSVVFLSNLFGIVDGVLHGTGSQILGAMFGVFNSAVIALGSIIIMYTLIVSTMNTAHEGQFLGQKWSSIWVPVRSVVGIALLMPKASGYCMIQIFVMWVCVQGIGAADKIWNAALDYLNRGGVIVKPQVAMTKPGEGDTKGTGAIYTGAVAMLEGQVCMLAIQNALSDLRQAALAQKSSTKEGICQSQTDPAISYFCDNPVPDFVSTVDFIKPTKDWNQANTSSSTPTLLSAQMPNFNFPQISYSTLSIVEVDGKKILKTGTAKVDNPYNALNGVCGTIKWNSFMVNASSIGLSSDDQNTLNLSRGVAVQQLYSSVSMVAQAMINNVKFVDAAPFVSLQDQFGIPLTVSGTPCTKDTLGNCVAWGPQPSDTRSVLFQGTELVGAVLDYMNVMAPSLRLQHSDLSGASEGTRARMFISDAKQQGWLMAGSYFFKLALLNQLAMDMSKAEGEPDDSGLDKSSDLSQIYTEEIKSIKAMLVNLKACDDDKSNEYCKPLNELNQLLANSDLAKLTSSKIKDVIANPEPQSGEFANTIWGFVQNSLLLKQPGQPGQDKTKFTMNFNFGIKADVPGINNVSVPCGDSSIWVGCIVQAFLSIAMNIIFEVILPNLMAILMVIINQILLVALQVPLTLVGNIFISAVSALQNPLTNPIVALANMGVLYLNAAVEIWITVMTMAITAAANPIAVGPLIFIMTMITPLLGTWLGVMAGVGFVTAYYVPFIPFMVFTFGVIGWLIAVIEAMVAAPIVALGISSPEGDQALGKAEHAIMLLMNVFLRPGMMVIGYIAAIALSYVSVWVVNAGFINAVQFIQGSHSSLYNVAASTSSAMGTGNNSVTAKGGDTSGDNLVESGLGWHTAPVSFAQMVSGYIPESPTLSEHLKYGHVGWAGVFGLFFSILIYTTIYWTVVQESFNLVAVLPDKILRWIGGTQETIGQETVKWSEQTKDKVGGAGKETLDATAKGAGKAKEALDKKAADKAQGGAQVTPGGGGGGS